MREMSGPTEFDSEVTLDDPLDVSSGGTGANTAAGALSNLGAASSAALSTETTRAEGAEQTNASAVSNETTRAEGAELANANAVGVETSRAETTEALLAVGRILSNRGAIQASTQYNPGDVVTYKGQHVLITQAVTSSAWSNWFTLPQLTAGTYIPIDAKSVTYASDWGVVADSATDNTAALTKCLWQTYNNGGGIVMLPPGNLGAWIQISNTIIIPSGTVLAGHGIEDTFIKLAANSNCDMVQFAEYGSSTQAAILTTYLGAGAPSAFSIRNAFYSGLMNLCLDGNAPNQSASSYNYGLNAMTNPVSSGAPTDPNFDPTNFLFNVEITLCTGDGYNQFSSRGQMRVTDCLFRGNLGWGVVSGTDTLFTGCNFAQNGLGGFLSPHGSASGAAAKAYNNGQAISGPWVSGTAYAAKARVVYNGQFYGALNAVTSAVVPSSDTTNWVHLTAATFNIATAASLWGTGMAFVGSTAQECTWSSVGFQENSGSDVYLKGAIGVRVTGTSQTPNWNGPGTVQSTTNPSNYAVVVLDGAIGNMIDIAAINTGNAYLIRNINGSTHNDVRITGDASWATVMSPDSTALVGSGNSVRVNGAMLSDDVAAVFTATGLPGATSASRYVGASVGPPTSGTFVAGDWTVDPTGFLFVCVTGGSPGSWAKILSRNTNAALVQPVGTAAAAGSTGVGADAGHVHAGMSLLATTGTAGYALVNGTGNILTWTAPNDGNLHRVLEIGNQWVSSAETGGLIIATYTQPNGSAFTPTLFPAAQGAGGHTSVGGFVVEAGTTVTVSQSSALTGGAATVWIELWGM